MAGAVRARALGQDRPSEARGSEPSKSSDGSEEKGPVANFEPLHLMARRPVGERPMTKAELNYNWRSKRRAKSQQDEVGLLAWIEAEFKQIYEWIAKTVRSVSKPPSPMASGMKGRCERPSSEPWELRSHEHRASSLPETCVWCASIPRCCYGSGCSSTSCWNEPSMPMRPTGSRAPAEGGRDGCHGPWNRYFSFDPTRVLQRRSPCASFLASCQRRSA